MYGYSLYYNFSFLVGLKYAKGRKKEHGAGHDPWYITNCVFQGDTQFIPKLGYT